MARAFFPRSTLQSSSAALTASSTQHLVADPLHLAGAVATTWAVVQWPLALIYYFAPDTDRDWAFITPGSALATVLWIVASFGFRMSGSSK